MRRVAVILAVTMLTSLLLGCVDRLNQFGSEIELMPKAKEIPAITIERTPSDDWYIASPVLTEVMTEHNFFRGGRDGFGASSQFENFDHRFEGSYIGLHRYESAEIARGRMQERKGHLDARGVETFAGENFEGFGFRGLWGDLEVYELVIALERFTFYAFVSFEDYQRYVVSLVDKMGYKDSSEISRNSLQEFHDAVVALERFGIHDSGSLRGMVFDKGHMTVILNERGSVLGEADLERLYGQMQTPGVEVHIVKEIPYLHYWSTWWGAEEMYAVSIVYGQLEYEFMAPISQREELDMLVAELGF